MSGMGFSFDNKFNHKIGTDIQIGDKIQIVVRSPLYCNEDEEPIFHSGVLQDIGYKEFRDGSYPVDILVKFNKDDLYDEGEEEYINLSEIEDVFIKKYEVTGYGMLNEGVTLSVKGNGIGKIIWFTYKNGSLIPEFISDGSITKRKRITDEDMKLINEIKKYSAAEKFSHFVLSKSTV